MTERELEQWDAATLISMLPAHTLTKFGNGSYIARWRDYTDGGLCLEASSRTSPAHALARLAVSLYEHGVIESWVARA